jgi:hypothetical protein
VLAYLSWHRPAPDVEKEAYEQALERFHRSLAHRPPSGFRGSASFRAPTLPWLKTTGPGVCEDSPREHPEGYEDWYLLDGWSAVGVLEEAVISRGHITAHDSIAKLTGPATSAVYRLGEGHASLTDTRVAVWVARDRGYKSPTIADLLGDGMDRASGGLWRRCVGLGPAPEYCLLAGAVPAGVAPSRLPAGWNATTYPREALWDG